MITTVTSVQRFATKTLYTRARATDGSTMLAPMRPGAGKGLTMGGRQQVYRKYERYQSERVDGASCLCSDDVTMMVSDGGDKLIRWSSGPDHIEPTLGPCYGKNGEVGRGRAAGRCASARDAENCIT